MFPILGVVVVLKDIPIRQDYLVQHSNSRRVWLLISQQSTTNVARLDSA